MGVKYSELPVASEVASDDYIAILDSSEDLTKRIPLGHASTATAYGLGSETNYGHNKVIDSLGQTVFTNGEALSAHQGNVLANDLGTFEPGNRAAYAHAEGEYFMWIGQFVKVTSAIAVGDTIELNSNVEATSVSSILSQLNNNINGVYAQDETALAQAMASYPAGTMGYTPEASSMELNQIYNDLGIREDGSTAGTAHANGSYFLWNGDVVQATAAISAGGTISSSNTTRTNIGNVLTQLNSKVVLKDSDNIYHYRKGSVDIIVFHQCTLANFKSYVASILQSVIGGWVGYVVMVEWADEANVITPGLIAPYGGYYKLRIDNDWMVLMDDSDLLYGQIVI